VGAGGKKRREKLLTEVISAVDYQTTRAPEEQFASN
jgi:hypothetical protein